MEIRWQVGRISYKKISKKFAIFALANIEFIFIIFGININIYTHRNDAVNKHFKFFPVFFCRKYFCENHTNLIAVDKRNYGRRILVRSENRTDTFVRFPSNKLMALLFPSFWHLYWWYRLLFNSKNCFRHSRINEISIFINTDGCLNGIYWEIGEKPISSSIAW